MTTTFDNGEHMSTYDIRMLMLLVHIAVRGVIRYSNYFYDTGRCGQRRVVTGWSHMGN
jgi:hypothetical protein